jgi:hypothetical protein
MTELLISYVSVFFDKKVESARSGARIGRVDSKSTGEHQVCSSEKSEYKNVKRLNGKSWRGGTR